MDYPLPSFSRHLFEVRRVGCAGVSKSRDGCAGAICQGTASVAIFSSFSFLLSSLELSDTKVYEPCIRARLGTAAHFCEVVVLKFSSPLLTCDYYMSLSRMIDAGGRLWGARRSTFVPASLLSLLRSSLALSDTNGHEP